MSPMSSPSISYADKVKPPKGPVHRDMVAVGPVAENDAGTLCIASVIALAPPGEMRTLLLYADNLLPVGKELESSGPSYMVTTVAYVTGFSKK